jgi:hypothetical protein
MESNTSETKSVGVEQANGIVFSLDSLYAFLLKLTDQRKRRGIRYRLATVLVLLILAKLCGQDKPYGIAEWVKNRSEFLVEALQLKRTCLPHHSTYRRILDTGLDGEELEQLISQFLTQRPQVGQSVVIAMDGKTLRGTITAGDPLGLHLLAAYLPGEGIVLMQMVVEKDKENEITVAPKLLQCLDLRDKVVVADAMHAQRNLSAQIVAAGGDYVWIVKDNQPRTCQAIEQLFAPEKPVAGLGCPPMDFQQARSHLGDCPPGEGEIGGVVVGQSAPQLHPQTPVLRDCICPIRVNAIPLAILIGMKVLKVQRGYNKRTKYHVVETSDVLAIANMTDQLTNALTLSCIAFLGFLLWALSITLVLRDVNRRGLPGYEQVAWLVLAALLPLIGGIAYLFSRLLDRFFSPGVAKSSESQKRLTAEKERGNRPRRLPTVAAVDTYRQTVADTSLDKVAAPVKGRHVRMVLDVLAGPSAGLRYPIETLPVQIGRGSLAALSLDADHGVSRQHAEIYEADGRMRIRDLKSTHGTYLNGQRITDESLNPGDHLSMGLSTLVFWVEDSDGAA